MYVKIYILKKECSLKLYINKVIRNTLPIAVAKIHLPFIITWKIMFLQQGKTFNDKNVSSYLYRKQWSICLVVSVCLGLIYPLKMHSWCIHVNTVTIIFHLTHSYTSGPELAESIWWHTNCGAKDLWNT